MSKSSERWDRVQRATSFDGLSFKKYVPEEDGSPDKSRRPKRKHVKRARGYDPLNPLHTLDSGGPNSDQ